MKKLYLINLSVFLFLGIIVNAQETNNEIIDNNKQDISYRHSLHTTVSSTGFFYGSSISYEYLLFKGQSKYLSSLSAKLTYGIVAYPNFNSETESDLPSNMDFYSYSSISIVAITGKQNNHLEINSGLAYINDGSELMPYIALGYRYQKPTGGLFFRTGVGFPEFGVYIGLGYSL